MALILGVDPSAKKIALVALEPLTLTQIVHTVTLYAKGQTRQDNASLLRAMHGMADFAERVAKVSVNDRVAYVEKPLIGRGGATTTIKQAYVGGIIRACLVEAGFEVRDVNVSTWRKELAIRGKDTRTLKTATAQVVRAHLPKIAAQVEGDSDLIDAAAIVLYGQRQHSKADILLGVAGPSEVSLRGRRH